MTTLKKIAVAAAIALPLVGSFGKPVMATAFADGFLSIPCSPYNPGFSCRCSFVKNPLGLGC